MPRKVKYIPADMLDAEYHNYNNGESIIEIAKRHNADPWIASKQLGKYTDAIIEKFRNMEPWEREQWNNEARDRLERNIVAQSPELCVHRHFDIYPDGMRRCKLCNCII